MKSKKAPPQSTTTAPAPPNSGRLHLALTVGLLLIVITESLLLLQAYLPATLPQPDVRVMIVGQPSGALQTLLNSEDFRLAGIRWIKTADQGQVQPEDFAGADVVIFQGQEFCPQALDEFAQFLEDHPPDVFRRPPNQLLFGNACSRVPANPLIGWNALLWDKTIHNDLAQYYTIGQDALPRFERGYMVVTTDHRVFNGIKNDYVTNAVLYRTYPTWVLAQVADERPMQPQYIDGSFSKGNIVVLQENGYGGTALYVGFEPAYDADSIGSRNLVLNALLYLGDRAE